MTWKKEDEKLTPDTYSIKYSFKDAKTLAGFQEW